MESFKAGDLPSSNHAVFTPITKTYRGSAAKIANVVDATRRKKSLGTLDRISPRNCRSLASFCVNVTF